MIPASRGKAIGKDGTVIKRELSCILKEGHWQK